MEAYNSSTSLTTSSSPYSKQSSEETKGLKMPQSYHLSLHSIRKPQMKPWKKPIAPLPPTPPRVYKVDPINFRDLVQKLTGAPEPEPVPEPQHQPRLQSVAPPPLDLAKPTLYGRDFSAVPSQLLPSPAKTPLSALYQELMSESLDATLQRRTTCYRADLLEATCPEEPYQLGKTMAETNMKALCKKDSNRRQNQIGYMIQEIVRLAGWFMLTKTDCLVIYIVYFRMLNRSQLKENKSSIVSASCLKRICVELNIWTPLQTANP
ncbi:hypothetical protein D5086_014451 [Populus alba]|uniref:Uncharacterized protein n=1 Tax=Populus alba TaxID=43335 RepID=A0ACC4BY92_POPAL